MGSHKLKASTYSSCWFQLLKIYNDFTTIIVSINKISTILPINLSLHRYFIINTVGLDLCMKRLALDPSRRISMKEAMKHPYFADILPEDIARYSKC